MKRHVEEEASSGNNSKRRRTTSNIRPPSSSLAFDDDDVTHADVKTKNAKLLEKYKHLFEWYHQTYDESINFENASTISFKIREIFEIPQLDGIILAGKTTNNEGIHVLTKMEPYIYIDRKKPFKTTASVDKYLNFLERFISELDVSKIRCRNPYLVDESYRYKQDKDGNSLYGTYVDPKVVEKNAKIQSRYLFNKRVNTYNEYGYNEHSKYPPKWNKVMSNVFVKEKYNDPNDDYIEKTRYKTVMLTHKKTSAHYHEDVLRIAKVYVRKPFMVEKLKQLFESEEYYNYVVDHVAKKRRSPTRGYGEDDDVVPISKNSANEYHDEDYLVRTYESEYQMYTNMALNSIFIGKWHNLTKYTVCDQNNRFSFKKLNVFARISDIVCDPDKEFLVSNRIVSYDIETAAGSTKYSTDASRFPIAFQGLLPSELFYGNNRPSIYKDRVSKRLETYGKNGINTNSIEFIKNTDPIVVFGVVVRDEGMHRGYDYAEGKIFIYKNKLANPTKKIEEWKKKLALQLCDNIDSFSIFYANNDRIESSSTAAAEFESIRSDFEREPTLALKWFYDKVEVVECSSEMEMMFYAIRYIQMSDSDNLSGWNISNFDDIYIISRYAYHKYVKHYALPEFNMTCFIDGVSKIKTKDNKLYVNHDGYVVNDGYQIFQKNKEDLPNYKLGFVAHELLKYPKTITNYAIIMAHGCLHSDDVDPSLIVSSKTRTNDKQTDVTFFDNYRFIVDTPVDIQNAYALVYLKLLWNAANDEAFAKKYAHLWKTDDSDNSKTFELCMKKIEWAHEAAAPVWKLGGYDMTIYGIYNFLDNIIPICALSKKGIFVAQESFAAVTGVNYSAVYTEGQMYKVVNALRICCKTEMKDDGVKSELENVHHDTGDDSSLYLFPDTGNLHYHYAGVFRGSRTCDEMVRKKYNEYTLLYKLRKYENEKLLKLKNNDLIGETFDRRSNEDRASSRFEYFDAEANCESEYMGNFLFDRDGRDTTVDTDGRSRETTNVRIKLAPASKSKTSDALKKTIPILSDTVEETDYSHVPLYGVGIADATSNQGGLVLVPYEQGFHKEKVITDDASSMYPANMAGVGLDKEQRVTSTYAKKHKIAKYRISTTTIGSHELNLAGEVVVSEKEAIYCGSEIPAVKQTHFLTTETGVVYNTIMKNFDERDAGKQNKVLWGAVVKSIIPKTPEEIMNLFRNPVKIMMSLLKKGDWSLKNYDITFEKLEKLGLICSDYDKADEYYKSRFESDLNKWKELFFANIASFANKRKISSIINVIDRCFEFENALSAIQTAELWSDNYDKYQLAVKCLMNSLYGIFMMLYGPLSDPAVSATVTGFGRFLISCVKCAVERQTATFAKRSNGFYDKDPAGVNPSFKKDPERAKRMPKSPFPIEETEIRTIKGVGKFFRLIDDGIVDLVVKLFKTFESLVALYGDTDSVMIKLPLHSIVNGDQAYDTMERLTDMINSYLFSKIKFQPEKYSEGMVVTSRQKTYDMMAFMERKKQPNWLFKGADKSDIMPFLKEFINGCKQFLFTKSSEGFKVPDILSIIFLKTQKMLLKFSTNQLPISLIAITKKLNKYTKGGTAQHNVVADKKIERGEEVSVGDNIIFIPILEIVQTEKKTRRGIHRVKELAHSVEDADYVLNHINTMTIDYEEIFEKKMKNCLFAFLSSVFAKITDLPYADSPFTSIRNFKMNIVSKYMDQIESYIESILLYGELGIKTRFSMRRQMLEEKMSKLKKKPPTLRECACCFKFYRERDSEEKNAGRYEKLKRRLPENVGTHLVTLCPTCLDNYDYHRARFESKLKTLTIKYRTQRTICNVCIEAPLIPKPESFQITPENCDFTLCSVHKLKSYLKQQIARLENLIFSFDIYASKYASEIENEGPRVVVEYDDDRTGLETDDNVEKQIQKKIFETTYDVSLSW
jgi:DNA polymerase elongation subunit (family B)